MSELQYCRPCATYHWRGEACLPLWDVWQSEDERANAQQVAGRDASDAAERWAAQDDAGGDYSIVSGDPAEVDVAPGGEPGPVLRFRVTGESVPSYSAESIEVPS